MRPVVLEDDFGKNDVFREFRFGGRVENYNGGGGKGKEVSNGCDENGQPCDRDGLAAVQVEVEPAGAVGPYEFVVGTREVVDVCDREHTVTLVAVLGNVLSDYDMVRMQVVVGERRALLRKPRHRFCQLQTVVRLNLYNRK